MEELEMEEKIKFTLDKFEFSAGSDGFGIVNYEVKTENDTFNISHKLNIKNDNDLQLLIDVENYIRNNITESKL